MTAPETRNSAADSAGMGVGLLIGGVCMAVLTVSVPQQVGLFDISSFEAWLDPVGLMFGAFTLVGVALAVVGGLYCRRAYTLFKTSGRPDKAGLSHD